MNPQLLNDVWYTPRLIQAVNIAPRLRAMVLYWLSLAKHPYHCHYHAHHIPQSSLWCMLLLLFGVKRLLYFLIYFPWYIASYKSECILLFISQWRWDIVELCEHALLPGIGWYMSLKKSFIRCCVINWYNNGWFAVVESVPFVTIINAIHCCLYSDDVHNRWYSPHILPVCSFFILMVVTMHGANEEIT